MLDGKYRPAAEREWEKVLFDPVRPATIDADGKLTIRDLGADGSSVWPFTARASPGSPGSCSPAAGWTWGH